MLAFEVLCKRNLAREPFLAATQVRDAEKVSLLPHLLFHSNALTSADSCDECFMNDCKRLSNLTFMLAILKVAYTSLKPYHCITKSPFRSGCKENCSTCNFKVITICVYSVERFAMTIIIEYLRSFCTW